MSFGGDYVDVGAHHPLRFSNTYRLFLDGWKGINIDPLPECMKAFKNARPNDVNLNVACGETSGELEYYSFEEPAYNTLDVEQAQDYLKRRVSPLKEKIKVPVLPLKNIFDKYLPQGQTINFMNLDVENYEIHVLKGNDWERYRPEVMIVECFVGGRENLMDIYQDEKIKFMLERDYRVVAKAFNATFLMDNQVK